MTRKTPKRVVRPSRIMMASVAVALVTATFVAVGARADTVPIPDCAAPTGLGQQCEHNMTRSTDFRSGEPEIAVNPTDPLNMVYVTTKYKYVRVGAGDTKVDVPGAVTQILGGGTLNCYIYYTFDGGRSWYETPVPLGTRPECADPMVAVHSDGTFYVAFDWAGGDNNAIIPKLVEAPPYSSHDVAVASSTDGGRTWSGPVATGTTSDRPFFRVDSASGKLYEASGDFNAGASALFLAERGVQGDGRYLAVSSDRGVTWNKPVPLPGRQLAVNNGLLITAAQSQSVNQGLPGVHLQQGAAQLTLYVSTDDGHTFKSFAATDSSGNPVLNGQELGGPEGIGVSADPTTPGRFALMQLSSDGNYELYTTSLDGNGVPQVWSGPTIINPGSGANKPWMDFGPNGVLGVMWKTADINVYATVSRDGGTTFATPVRVNGETFPAEDSTQFAGDDLSWITVDGTNTYIGWGDTRTGYLNAFFARVPLSAYK